MDPCDSCYKLKVLKKAKDTRDYAKTSEHSAVAIDDFRNSVRDVNLVPAVECKECVGYVLQENWVKFRVCTSIFPLIARD